MPLFNDDNNDDDDDKSLYSTKSCPDRQVVIKVEFHCGQGVVISFPSVICISVDCFRVLLYVVVCSSLTDMHVVKLLYVDVVVPNSVCVCVSE